MSKKINSSVSLFFLCSFITAFVFTPLQKAYGQKAYEPTWRSLKQHSIPQWLKDAKFGIYCHWNPPRGEAVSPDFGKNFDAEEWAALFEKAGAQFAGPVAEHWGGYAMWDSRYTENDSFDKPPHKDILGELSKEIRKRGMKLFASFHRPEDKLQQELRTKDREVVDKYKPDLVWFDVSLGGTLDARNWGRYVGGKQMHNKENYLLAEKRGLPSGGVKEQFRKEFIAYYYNKEQEWDKEVEVLYKEYDLPPGVGMVDIENGRMCKLCYVEWINDMGIGRPTSWWYEEGMEYKSANTLIDELVDMVSKNGRMLLNVGPRQDGTFTEAAKERLLEIGKWLEVNGEAIYDTTTWVIFGEGPTELNDNDVYEYSRGSEFDFDRLASLIEKGQIQTGHYTQDYEVNYKPEDIRFTVKGDFLYAICLGWPGDEIEIKSLGTRAALTEGEIKEIRMLGVEDDLDWEHSEEALVIKTPDEKPCEYAYAFKIVRKSPVAQMTHPADEERLKKNDRAYEEFYNRVKEEEPYIGFFETEEKCIKKINDEYKNARRAFFLGVSVSDEEVGDYRNEFIEFCRENDYLKEGCEEEWEKTLTILCFELYANKPIFEFSADNIKEYRNLIFAEYPNKKLALDLFLPEEPAEKLIPCVVCIHGGGWRVNRRVWFEPFAKYLASEGMAAVTIDYRMLPAVKILDIVHDCKAAVRWVRANAEEYDIDRDRIGALGASAGAHLVALLATTADKPELEGAGGNSGVSSEIQAAAGFATPAFRMKDETVEIAGRFGISREHLKLVSPYEHVSAESAPLYLVHGTADETVDPQDSRDLYDKYKALGAYAELKWIPGKNHGFYEGTDMAIELASDFFKEQFGIVESKGTD